MTTAYINRIATSVPPHDVHRPFIDFAEGMLPEGTTRSLFRRMVRMSAIEHRYSFLQPIASENGIWRDAEDLYATGSFPGTARRMQAFEKFAPQLAVCALNKLGLTTEERERVTHVIVTSCTGLYAPGSGLRHRGSSRFESFGGANHDRVHGVLRSHQCAEVCPSHRAICAGCCRAHPEPGALHAAPAGDAGIWSRCCRSCFLPMAARPAW